MQKIGISNLFFLNFFVLLLLLAGCGTVVIPLLGAGAGVGIPYYAPDGADRTLNFPFQEVEVATPQVLEKMGIEITGEERTGDGKRIRALAHELEIEIDMKSITGNATRVTVNARKNTFLKDKATSEEIVNQLQKSLSATTEIEKTTAVAPAAPLASAPAAPPAPAPVVAPSAPAPAAPPAPAPVVAPSASAPAAPLAAAPVAPSAPAPAAPPAAAPVAPPAAAPVVPSAPAPAAPPAAAPAVPPVPAPAVPPAPAPAVPPAPAPAAPPVPIEGKSI